jgi:hypothetical protein
VKGGVGREKEKGERAVGRSGCFIVIPEVEQFLIIERGG